MVDVGEQAPEFRLPNQDGDDVALSDFRGQPVLIYFYPKDGTPGCTVQACELRDHWAEFHDAGVVVLGVSPDGIDSHAGFAAEHALPFDLLSDIHKEVLERYGAWGEKVVRGEKKLGVLRSTYLIDSEGRVADVWRDVDPASHVQTVTARL